jgi:hypothetical protein
MVALLATHLVFLSFQASRSLHAFNRWFAEDQETDCTIILVEEESHTKYLQSLNLPSLAATNKTLLYHKSAGKISAESQSLEQQHSMEVHAPPPDQQI